MEQKHEKIRRTCVICEKHTKDNVTLHLVQSYAAFDGTPKLDSLDMAKLLNAQQKLQRVSNGDYVCNLHFAPMPAH
jgi:hypothetical protein